jgi:hypothetical protein
MINRRHEDRYLSDHNSGRYSRYVLRLMWLNLTGVLYEHHQNTLTLLSVINLKSSNGIQRYKNVDLIFHGDYIPFMAWNVEYTDEFEAWRVGLDEE